jgi:hypothetical protein
MDSEGFVFVKGGRRRGKGGAAYHSENAQELLNLRLEHIRSQENNFIYSMKGGKRVKEITLQQKLDIFDESYNKYL